MRFAQRDFSLGEFSPRVLGRVDAPYYYRGARLMENYIPLPQGGAERRPGTLLCDEVDTVRDYVEIPYLYGDQTSHLILLSDTDILIYEITDGASHPSVNISRLEDEASADVIFNSPYSGITDIREVQPYQYKRELYFAHPDYPLYKMTSKEGVGFALETHILSYRSFSTAVGYEPGDVVAYDGEIFTPLASISAGASAPEDSGGWWADAGSVTPGLAAPIPAWTDTTFANGALVVYNERVWKAKVPSDGNELAHFGYEWIHNRPADSPLTQPGLWTGGYGSGYWAAISGALPVGTTTLLAYNAATGYVTGDYVYDSALGKIYTSIQDGNTGNTPSLATDWVKVGPAPDFNEPDRYPSLVAVHEDRLIILGTAESPDSIFMSRTSRFDEMSLGTDDDDAVIFSLGLASGESIAWAKSRTGLVLGTKKSEWLATGSGGGPLTPTSKSAYLQTNAGGARNGAMDIGDMLVFLQAGGRRLLRFVFSNDQQAYSTPDMAMLSEHVFSSGIKQMALQTNPDFILWMVRDDGTLVSATYNPTEQTFGFARHFTEGEIFSVAVTPTGDGEDDIWLTVKRTVDSTDYVFLEKFGARRQDEQSDWTYLDCASHLAITAAAIAVPNEIYVQEIKCLVDGANHTAITPTAITPTTTALNYGTTKAVVGFPFISKLRPQKFVPMDGELETDIRTAQVGLQLYNTLGMTVGANETEGSMYPVVFQDTTQILGAAPVPFSGEIPQTIDMTFSDEEGILIRQEEPFPGKILGIVYSVMTGRNP